MRALPLFRFALVLFIAICCCVSADVGLAQAQGYVPENLDSSRRVGAAHPTIQAFRIEGAQRVDVATVRSYMPLAVGDEATPDALDTTIKKLFETGLFADVQTVMEGSVLVVKVTENPVINQIVFEGNKALESNILRAEVQLKPRTVYTRTRVQNDVQRLLELYRRNGRFAAAIEPKIVTLEQNRVDLIFEITEGERTKINRISFVGNRTFSDGALRSVLSTKESAWYRLLSSDDTYDPERLAYDEELLRRHYLEQGYADFRVISSIAELTPDRSGFFITITVEEGERYRTGDITFESRVPEMPESLLTQHNQLSKGSWFNQRLIERTIDTITEALGNAGYAFVEIEPILNKNSETRVIDIAFVVREGPKVYVERLDISGNLRTLDSVVRREFQLAEGDPYNAARLQQSERNVRNLNFFRNATVETREGSAPDRIVIDTKVEEQSTGELSFGAGFSSTESLLGDIRLRERNFLGRGQDVRVGTTFSARRQEIDLGFTEPYFLGRDLSAGFDVYRVTREFQIESSYDEKRLGGGVRLGYKIGEYLSQSLNYNIREVQIGNVSSRASRFIRDQEGKALTSSIGQDLLYDRRDNRLEPTEGYFARISNEFAGLGGDVKFFRTQLSSGFYFPLAADEWVLGLTTETGYIVGWGGESIRINDRFFVGGSNLRGFELAGIGARDRDTRDALGGDMFAVGSAELRFPLGLPDELGITGSTFIDAGTLIDRKNNDRAGVFDTGSIRASAGVGIAWRSPFGPVRVDFAQAFVKEDHDQTEFFRFSFGTRF